LKGVWGISIIVSIFILGLIGYSQEAESHVAPTMVSGVGTPTIDGVIGAAEWSAAATVAITVNLPAGGTTSGTLYAMNDQNNLYLAVEYLKSGFSSVNDQVSFQFDNDHAGGARVIGDDAFFLNTKQSPTTFSDTVRTTVTPPCPAGSTIAQCEPLDTTLGGTNDGSGAVTNDGTKTMFEFSHPLNSGDVNDFSLTDTSTVGFHVRIGLKDPGVLQTVIPSTAQIANTDNYADIVLSPTPTLENACNDIEDIISNTTVLALKDKLEDALQSCQTALTEFNKTPPDNQAVMGIIEGAIGDIETAIGLDPTQDAALTNLMDDLAGIARQLASDAINAATAGGDPVKIADAQQSLADGDALRALGQFKNAANEYKDALAKAESA